MRRRFTAGLIVLCHPKGTGGFLSFLLLFVCFLQEKTPAWLRCSAANATMGYHPLVETHSFSSKEAQQLLHNKFVVILGDSIYRSIYKDLISILQADKLLTVDELKQKGKPSFANDKLVQHSGLGCGNRYREVREFCTDHHLVRWYFMPRVYSDYVERILDDLQTDPKPDVVIFNSCLWDLNRYQEKVAREFRLPTAIKQYKLNLEKLFERLDRVLPQSCLAIWNTALPIGEEPFGALYKEMEGGYCSAEDVEKATPMDVVEANFYGASLACSYGFDVLDLHFFLRFEDDLRIKDRVHWNFLAHRFITRYLLTFIADSWGVELEKRNPSTGIGWNGTAADHPVYPQLPPIPQLCRDFFSADDAPIRQLVEVREAPVSYGGPYGNRPVAGFEYNPQDPSAQHGWLFPAHPPFEHHSNPYDGGPGGGLDCHDYPPNDGQLIPDPQFNDHQNGSCSRRGGRWNGLFPPETHPNGSPIPTLAGRARRFQRRRRPEFIHHHPHEQRQGAQPYPVWRGRGKHAWRHSQRPRFVWRCPSRS
nr:PC-esterase domain-containing protein 1A-like isoform X1 [Zootoca vivipara]